MKKLYALLLFLCLPFFINAQSWQRKNVINGATSTDLIKLSNGNLVSINTDGVYGSTDNASTWSKISADMDFELSSFTSDLEPEVLHLKNDTLYAYFRTNLFYSANNGLNWTKINIASLTPKYESTFAIKNNSIYITKIDFNTNLSTIFVSNNNGVNWVVADTTSAKINLYSFNNEIYVWGYTGTLWGSKSPLFKKIGADNKLSTSLTSGLPNNTDIRGLGVAGNNIVAMVPEYNLSQTIVATKLFGFNGTSWTYGTQFTENYSKLYNINGTCYHLFFNAPYFLKSKDGINWISVNIPGMNSYFTSIRNIGNNKTLATSRAGIFEIDSNLEKTSKNVGLNTSSLGDILEFKQKIYVLSPESGLYVSADNAQSFTSVQVNNFRNAYKMKMSLNNLYLFNDYLSPKDKIFTSTDGVQWDTVNMPNTNYASRQVICISDNGIWMQFSESNISVYRFYNDQSKSWTDVSSAVPSTASYFTAYKSTNGNMVVVNSYYEINKKVTKVYTVSSNASVWTSISHTLGELWYENTSIYNGEFYFLKNTYFKPDSLFKIKNDSLVFEKIIRYGSYKFYTDNFLESFYYKGNEIYCLGFDSLQQNSITIIKSTDGGLNWSAMNSGLTLGTQIQSLYFGNNLLASTNKGLYEYGTTGVFVSNEKESRFKLYPNPSSTFLNILFEENENYQVKIFGLDGKQIYNGMSLGMECNINTQLIPDGIYILKLSSQKAEETKKIIIQH